MEKASGELSLTVVTIIAIAAIGALVVALWPTLSNWINSNIGNVANNRPAGIVVDSNTINM